MGRESGIGVNRATKSGSRRIGVDRVVQIINKYPKIDSFSVAWVEAGGQIVEQSGQFVLAGMTKPMTVDQLAKVLKIQSRVTEAKQRGKIDVSDRNVIRVEGIRSTGFVVAG